MCLLQWITLLVVECRLFWPFLPFHFATLVANTKLDIAIPFLLPFSHWFSPIHKEVNSIDITVDCSVEQLVRKAKIGPLLLFWAMGDPLGLGRHVVVFSILLLYQGYVHINWYWMTVLSFTTRPYTDLHTFLLVLIDCMTIYYYAYASLPISSNL